MLNDFTSQANLFFPFWEKLKKEDKDYIINSSKYLSGGKGEILHGGTSDCTGVLAVLKGSLRCYILSEDGREVTLYRLNKGEICVLSASCILDNINFDVYISSETEYEIALINSKAYDNIKLKYSEAESFTNAIIAERFSDVMWTVEKILFLSFDKRLAIFLLDYSAANGTDTVNLTHDDIAKNVGSAREVVSRMLKYFADDGLVSLSRGKTEILNKDKLKKMVL